MSYDEHLISMAGGDGDVLDRIQARADAATEGPWEVDRGVGADGVYSSSGSVTWDDHGGEVFKPADAEFIAHARTDIPALLAMVREQRAVIERVERANKELFDISAAPDFGTIEARAAYRDASRAIRTALTATDATK